MAIEFAVAVVGVVAAVDALINLVQRATSLGSSTNYPFDELEMSILVARRVKSVYGDPAADAADDARTR